MLLAICGAALAGCSDDDNSATATATSAPATPMATATPSPLPADELASSIAPRGAVPEADPVDLALRFGRAVAPPAPAPFAGERQVGEQRPFNVLLLSGPVLSHRAPPQFATVTATLQAKTEHAYFYADDALAADRVAFEEAAAMFEETVWPVVTAAFGPPPSPGIDGDPRIIVLQADLGGAAGGYVSNDDIFARDVRPRSNEAEIIYLDRTLRPGGGAFNVVLAHELQHLIHIRNDNDDEAWVNEGLSETALGLAGGAVSSVGAWESAPDTQLNSWPESGTGPHYGGGAAFFRYLADRFGGDAALGQIARATGDGAAGVEEFLRSAGQPLLFRDVFADWQAANVLNRAAGPYGNPTRPVEPSIERELRPGEEAAGDATQFGTDYYALAGLDGGEYVLRFAGAADVAALPLDHGDGVWWGNIGDEIDARLTIPLDLSGTTSPSLTFRTWFDIERWYDWAYVAVSTDSGTTWKALAGQHSSTEDPLQTTVGPGYTGRSGGGEAPAWVDERIDLSAYAGRDVLLRFEYVTDGSTYGSGFVVDDVAVGGSPLQDGWQAEGFARVGSTLEQTYIVRLIAETASGEPLVRDTEVTAGRGELRFSADGIERAWVAVAGSTEGTEQRSPYTIALLRP